MVAPMIVPLAAHRYNAKQYAPPSTPVPMMKEPHSRLLSMGTLWDCGSIVSRWRCRSPAASLRTSCPQPRERHRSGSGGLGRTCSPTGDLNSPDGCRSRGCDACRTKVSRSRTPIRCFRFAGRGLAAGGGTAAGVRSTPRRARGACHRTGRRLAATEHEPDRGRAPCHLRIRTGDARFWQGRDRCLR